MTAELLSVLAILGRVYISGPITTGGAPIEDNLARFFAVADAMAAAGVRAYNPASVKAEDWTQHDYMQFYLNCVLPDCDAMFMLKGWEGSKGACIEHEYALSNGMTVLYE